MIYIFDCFFKNKIKTFPLKNKEINEIFQRED